MVVRRLASDNAGKQCVDLDFAFGRVVQSERGGMCHSGWW